MHTVFPKTKSSSCNNNNGHRKKCGWIVNVSVANSKHKTEKKQTIQQTFFSYSIFFCAIVIFGILSIEHRTISEKKQKVNDEEIYKWVLFMELRMHKNENDKKKVWAKNRWYVEMVHVCEKLIRSELIDLENVNVYTTPSSPHTLIIPTFLRLNFHFCFLFHLFLIIIGSVALFFLHFHTYIFAFDFHAMLTSNNRYKKKHRQQHLRHL